jgi:hypothetical protein
MRRDGATTMRAIEEASEIVRGYKGAYSGEHGDGLVRSEWVAWQFGPRLTRAFGEIKDLFDPAGLMNPGKIVRATKMDDATLFRFRPGQQTETLRTALDWSAWNVQNDPVAQTVSPPGSGGDPAEGFAKAVEMCNNNGPLPQVRRGNDVSKLPRNARRGSTSPAVAPIRCVSRSGQLGAGARSRRSRCNARSTCVSCKGCRRECPTGVDMAKMKIEVLYHRQRARASCAGSADRPLAAGHRGPRGCHGCSICGTPCPARGDWGSRCRLPRAARFPMAERYVRGAECGRAERPDVVPRRYLHPLLRAGEQRAAVNAFRGCRLPRARRRRRSGGSDPRRLAVLRPHLSCGRWARR